MNEAFLTEEEIRTLTGYKIKRYQINWLIQNGWRFAKNAAGRPIVSRLYFNQKMTDSIPTAPQEQLPDFAAVA